MKLTMDKLAETLVALAAQLKQARCDAACDAVADLEFSEEIQITVELIAPGGLNLLETTEKSVQDPVINLTSSPETVVREENDATVSVSVAKAFTSTSTQVKTEEKSTTKNTTPFHEVVTERRGIAPSTVDAWEWEDSTGVAGTITTGKDIDVTDNTFK